MKPIWSGGISFGLIYIPVNLYTATEPLELNLDLLSKQDLSPIRYARIDTKTGKEVAWKDVVKGFRFEKGDYVLLEEADFEKAAMERSKTISIECFVQEAEIDAKYYEKPYYLEPEESAQKTYALLVDALSKSGKVGVAEFIFKNREHLCTLQPEGDVLILNQMRYQSEIRELKELKIPKSTESKENELKLALQLIDTMTEKFDPADFKDDYIGALKKLIEAKAKHKTFKVAAAAPPTPTEVSDLLAALEKSLKGIKVAKPA